MEMTTEQIQILSLKHDDCEKAFETLYKTWSGKLYNFLMRMSGGDHALTEDIVQDVFVCIWNKRAQLDENKSFGNLLCTIAKDKLLNVYKHRMIEALYAQAVQNSDKEIGNSTQDTVDHYFLSEYLTQIIDQLPAARQRIFRMSRQQHLSNKEIAQRLHLSENTVESQLGKALKFIRQHLEEYYTALVIGFIVELLPTPLI